MMKTVSFQASRDRRHPSAHTCHYGVMRRGLVSATLPPPDGSPALTADTRREPECELGIRRGFTLIEVLIALSILAIVLVVVHTIFLSAIQLRDKTERAIQDAVPLQHALLIIKRDVENLTAPGGTLSGTLQTPLIAGSSTSSAHAGRQCGPTFYTASGTLDDNAPWSEMRKVTYYLEPSTNGAAGLDLIRSVTRNLLPVSTEEYTDQRLLSGVNNLTFEFYDGSQWVDTWDSTITSSSSSNSLPTGIRVQLTQVTDPQGSIATAPVEMVIPIAVQSITNSISGNPGGGQ